MFKLFKTSFKTFIAVVAATLFSTTPVQAGAIVPCGSTFCTADFSVMFNGSNAGGGEFIYDAKTGDIPLNTSAASISGNGVVTSGGGLMWDMGNGDTIMLNSLSGNADPILGFALGATTGSGVGTTFGFTFNLPIALEGQINANSSASYTLTSLSSAGAQIGTIGGGKIVSASEVDTSVGGLGSFNKGVDVGDTFFFNGGPKTQNSSVFTASNSFTGDLAYDLMTVKVDFALSANSSVGISGFVQQVVVPVPAAA